MDVNPQRVAVVAARTTNPRDSDFTGADSGDSVPFAATLEVTNATIAIYDEDNGEHSVELTQRFARASAFTHVLLLKSPQEIRPTIDTQKALLLVRFPADFSRKLDTFQTAPLQLILDGRNSNSAQIAANYLQQIVKNYQQELLEGKPKPNNSELVVRNWYNPNLDYKWLWCRR